MKLTAFCRPAISLVMLAAGCVASYSCGPYEPIIPTPEFFRRSDGQKLMHVFEREENLRLWQGLTSESIPLADIEQAVYRNPAWNPGRDPGENRFYIYLKNTSDYEITDFLQIAKELEKRREEMNSPWYYPQDRQYFGAMAEYGDIIERCRLYDGDRLKDRYALQVSRALFASRRYADCIEYVDSAFAAFPADNLMRRMAERYSAGCWSRLGSVERADSMFAATGDIWSIHGHDPVEYMAECNPGAPQLMEYVRENAADTLFMLRMVPMARRLLADSRVSDKGDWNFMLAYVYNEFDDDARQARKYIDRALEQGFSSDELRDLARAYKMKLDARTGNTHTLLADLRWMESKIDPLNADATEWVRRCRNIVYADWVPRLWKSGDYSTAILLCAYADNLEPQGLVEVYPDDVGWCGYYRPSVKMNISQLRDSERYFNTLDYSCLSFQMGGSLSSARLASVYGRMMSRTPLYDFLRRKARTDSDYYYELIGTVALREENYGRAVSYLSRVSLRYLKTMNIGCYLTRNPFSLEPTEWNVADAKLEFARRMLRYRRTMERGRTADERGMARLMYAIGRRNSFGHCWALTQYWQGEYVGLFYPALQYWFDDFVDNNYGFLYDHDIEEDHRKDEDIYAREVEAALAMLATDEARAEAEYMLGNLKTVIKRYGNTATADRIKTTCDNWKAWL